MTPKLPDDYDPEASVRRCAICGEIVQSDEEAGYRDPYGFVHEDCYLDEQEIR